MNDKFSYDALPYPSFTFAQTHPDRLATMGTFYGLDAADPTKCRVLELGCGTGANLAAMAYSLPSSEFVGIDLSEVHIDQANEMKSAVGIPNVTFLKQDVIDLDLDTLGNFDYIVAHGLFSWVPEFVRERVLQTYARCLAPNGIGYISYNAYPGCHVRKLVQGMMKYRIADETDPLAQVNTSVRFLSELSDAADSRDEYQAVLRSELEGMRDRSASNIHHDDLTEINQPFYFHEFAAMLQAHGLQYLTESAPSSSNPQRLSKAAQELVERLSGGDIIKSEQYADFCKGTRFRSTLFCREELNVDRRPAPEILQRFFIASDVEPDSLPADLSSGQPQRFAGPHGATFELNHPMTVAALVHLASISPKSLPLDELLEVVRSFSADERSDVEITTNYLFQLFQAGFVSLHRFRPGLPSAIAERPRASRLARWQLSIGSETVTTLYGISLSADDVLLKEMLLILDGSKDRGKIGDALEARLEVPEKSRGRFRHDLPRIVEKSLGRLQRLGLLVA